VARGWRGGDGGWDPASLGGIVNEGSGSVNGVAVTGVAVTADEGVGRTQADFPVVIRL
jgi:hypothetical protein